jgi:hypothetical protein
MFGGRSKVNSSEFSDVTHKGVSPSPCWVTVNDLLLPVLCKNTKKIISKSFVKNIQDLKIIWEFEFSLFSWWAVCPLLEFFFFNGTRVWTQGLTFVRQVLSTTCAIASAFFAYSYFLDRALHVFPGLATDLDPILHLPCTWDCWHTVPYLACFLR